MRTIETSFGKLMKPFFFHLIGFLEASLVSLSVPSLSSTIPKINLNGITEGGLPVSLARIYSQKTSIMSGGFGLLYISYQDTCFLASLVVQNQTFLVQVRLLEIFNLKD